MLPEIGQYCVLDVVKKLSFGFYLDAGPFGEILLPKNEAPSDLDIEDEVEVFIYTDSDDRIIATTRQPYAKVGDFAYLKVVDVGNYGAFLDWGLVKNLFVPFKEQNRKMQVGERHLVFLYLDTETDRIAATARLNRYLSNEVEGLNIGDEVDLVVAQKTDLGFKVIINREFWGLLHAADVFEQLYIGQHLSGFIKNIREDDRKADVTLRKPGFEGVKDSTEIILAALKANGGILPLSDNSPPQVIQEWLGMSKKTFKKGIGILYKQHQILLENDQITLL